MKRARVGLTLGLILLSTLLVPLASNVQGVNVTAWEALLVSGNESLSLAQSDLSANANLSAGIQLAKEAMDDFSSAATNASLSLRTTSSYARISADIDSLSAVNSTLVQLNNTIALACQITPANSSYVLQFQQECTSGKSFLEVAGTDLIQANDLLVSAESTPSAASLNQSELFILYAKGNISEAANVVSQLSIFTYSQRARQYLSGPFAQTLSEANRTVTTQEDLVFAYRSDVTAYQIFSAQQSTAIVSIDTQSAVISSDTSAALSALANLSTALQSEQVVLSEVSANLTEFYAQIPSALPSSLISELQVDINNVQSNITAANSATSNMQSEVNLFSQATLASMPSYVSSYGTSANSVEADNNALISSYTTLQNDLNTIVNSYPLLSVLDN